jgi:hypothetical protein
MTWQYSFREVGDLFPASARLFTGPLPRTYVLYYVTLFKLILPMPAIGRIYGKTRGADDT